MMVPTPGTQDFATMREKSLLFINRQLMLQKPRPVVVIFVLSCDKISDGRRFALAPGSSCLSVHHSEENRGRKVKWLFMQQQPGKQRPQPERAKDRAQQLAVPPKGSVPCKIEPRTEHSNHEPVGITNIKARKRNLGYVQLELQKKNMKIKRMSKHLTVQIRKTF